MRRRIGLIKAYDIIRITEDRPEQGLKAGQVGVITDILYSRGVGAIFIDLFTEYYDENDEDEEGSRSIGYELFKYPPIQIIDVYFEDQRGFETIDIFPDDRRFINIDLPPRAK